MRWCQGWRRDEKDTIVHEHCGWWCVDADGDGYGNCADWLMACNAPPGYVAGGGDCNDGDAGQGPGAIEICGDGLDNNCSDGIDEAGCTRYHHGTITADETWRAEEVHVVIGDVLVEGAAAPTLTVEAGTIVQFTRMADLFVGVYDKGRLLVQGSESAEVVFRSSLRTPSPGDWGQVRISYHDQGSILEHLRIEHAGRGPSAALYIHHSNPELYDVAVISSGGSGIVVVGSNTNTIRPHLHNIVSKDNQHHGIATTYLRGAAGVLFRIFTEWSGWIQREWWSSNDRGGLLLQITRMMALKCIVVH